MVIISKPRLNEYAAQHAQAADLLNAWYHICNEADWSNFNQLRADLAQTDYIGKDRYVFNIGSSFRLVCMIFFDVRTIFIRGFFTHSEYNKRRAQLPSL